MENIIKIKENTIKINFDSMNLTSKMTNGDRFNLKANRSGIKIVIKCKNKVDATNIIYQKLHNIVTIIYKEHKWKDYSEFFNNVKLELDNLIV